MRSILGSIWQRLVEFGIRNSEFEMPTLQADGYAAQRQYGKAAVID